MSGGTHKEYGAFGTMNTVQITAKRVLRATEKAAQVLLMDGRKSWFPYSQCPGLERIPIKGKGEFTCPTWLLAREKVERPNEMESKMIALEGTVIMRNDEAAFVKLDGGEEIWFPFTRCPELTKLPVHTKGFFECPSDILFKKGLMHYAMNLTSMIKDLRRGNLSIFQATHTQKIPALVLHCFAHDCAQRTLLQSYKDNKELHLSLWRATQIKRQWISGEASDEQLEQVRLEIRRLWVSAKGSFMRTVSAIWDATDKDAVTAANGAAQYVTFGILNASLSVSDLSRGVDRPEQDEMIQERSWQSNRLAELLEKYIEAERETPESVAR
ncbi:MAG TPA: hypothetical protein DCE42_30940 [Myxococcales bacterium]|nr:hypothetical protein [Deltaproteobacteria bacterium]MBU48575.1 hypothetical protein [Deltaproteobacteria bacterium]HAA59205.1 hypothetical protein [Myxococcales bacterium]|tara:strand:+ start:1628 stop:2608 length:981 start_codon:yes stop_codon:yes gene_type:complete